MTAFTDARPGQTFTLSGTAPGFDTLYGIPAVALGEDGCRLLAVGHLTDRAVLAVTNAYARRVWGQRILPGSKIADLTRSHTKHTKVKAIKDGEDSDGEDSAWRIDDAAPDDPAAQAATIIDIELLAYEDAAVQSECPACNRASRSTSLTAGPGRNGWGHYHHCRHCDHTWPTAPVHRPDLTKRRHFAPTRLDDCFACACLPDYPCTAGCTIQRDPLIGQRLCTTCRAQLTDDVWTQLAAVAYGTATTFDTLDDHRDRWLYNEALRGTPPAQATRSWQDRLTLTALRADLLPQPENALPPHMAVSGKA